MVNTDHEEEFRLPIEFLPVKRKVSALLLSCIAISQAAPGGARSSIYREQDYDGNYNFGYNVEDGYTGDVHGREEVKEGLGVAGSYSQLDPNGYIRTVEYRSDPYLGTRQTITGSENGLYVDTPDYQIRPDAPAVAVAPVLRVAPVDAPVLRVAPAVAPVFRVAPVDAPVFRVAPGFPVEHGVAPALPIVPAVPGAFRGFFPRVR